MRSPLPEPRPEAVEIETVWKNEQFEKRVAQWQAWWTLPFNHVQYCDAEGVPIGKPVKIEPYLDPKDKSMKRNPGDVNTDGIPPVWLKNHPEKPKEAASIRHNVMEVKAALNNVDEPELQRRVQLGLTDPQDPEAITTIAGIVEYFGMNRDKLVLNDDLERTRAEYVQEEIQLAGMDERMAEEINSYIVALAAKESKFDGGLKKNSRTAWGIMQLIDDVRTDQGYPADQRLSFVEEVEVAGEHLSNLHKQVLFWIDNTSKEVDGKWQNSEREADYLSVIKQCFATEADWEQYFLVPAVITSYNCGGQGMGEAIAFFVRDNQERLVQQQPVTGYDLFLEMSQYAYASDEGTLKQYGDDVVNYFPAIAAAKEVL